MFKHQDSKRSLTLREGMTTEELSDMLQTSFSLGPPAGFQIGTVYFLFAFCFFKVSAFV